MVPVKSYVLTKEMFVEPVKQWVNKPWAIQLGFFYLESLIIFIDQIFLLRFCYTGIWQQSSISKQKVGKKIGLL